VPGESAREASGASPSADLRIVFWYDRARPLDTFQYRVYDLRKHEFTHEVERWLADVRARFPRFEAYTRDVVLSQERGETEKLKTGSVVVREFLVIGSYYGYDFGGFMPGSPSLSPPRRSPSLVNPIVPPRRPTPPLFSAPGSGPIGNPNPFPYPYPRPHP
jgi:hypothetical protein